MDPEKAVDLLAVDKDDRSRKDSFASSTDDDLSMVEMAERDIEAKEVVMTLDQLLDEMDRVSESFSDLESGSKEDLSRASTSRKGSEEGPWPTGQGAYADRDPLEPGPSGSEERTSITDSGIIMEAASDDDQGASSQEDPGSSEQQATSRERRPLEPPSCEDGDGDPQGLFKIPEEDAESQASRSRDREKSTELGAVGGVVLRRKKPVTSESRQGSVTSTGEESSNRYSTSSIETVIARHPSSETGDKDPQAQRTAAEEEQEDDVPVEKILKIWKRRSQLSEGSWSSIDLTDVSDEELEETATRRASYRERKKSSGTESKRNSKVLGKRASTGTEDETTGPENGSMDGNPGGDDGNPGAINGKAGGEDENLGKSLSEEAEQDKHFEKDLLDELEKEIERELEKEKNFDKDLEKEIEKEKQFEKQKEKKRSERLVQYPLSVDHSVEKWKSIMRKKRKAYKIVEGKV